MKLLKVRFYNLLILTLVVTLATPDEVVALEKKRITLDVKQRKREKKKRKAAEAPRRSAVVLMKVEKKLITGINKTTTYLNKTAKSLPKKSQQRLQLLERVLNLYMENATYVRNEEERTYDQKWRRWESMGRAGAEPKLNSSRSNGLWVKVIKQSTLIDTEYPRSPNADKVLYNKAVGLQYIGREKQAAQILSQLVERFKNSNIVGDAFASLGDFYFDRNDFRNASNNYKKAARYRRSKRYLWSIFKLGWCAYNLGQYRQSMTYWKSVVAKSRSGGPEAQQLREEALRDLVYAFAELRQVSQAISYYKANGGRKFIGPFLLLLGEILADQGNFKQAIMVYRRFQSEVPYDPEGPVAQKEIINLLYVKGNLKRVWVELALFYNKYNARSVWAKRNQKDVVEATALEIKDQMLYYATLTHQKAIKDNNRPLNVEAKKGYLLFLQSYPAAKEVPGVKYLIADIEFFLKNYQAAGRYYYEIAALGKKKALRFNPQTNKFTNIHRESAVDMVRSYVKDFETEFKALKKRKPDFKKPKPLSVKAKNFVKACAAYVKWYPNDKERVKSCDTGLAAIFYHSGYGPAAVKYLRIVAIKYARAKEGPAAVRLIVPLMKDNDKKLAEISGEFLKIPVYANGEIGNLLRSLKRGAEKDAIVSEKNTLKRAKMYEAQARKYPKDVDVDKLWYNAAVDYMKAGAVKDSLRAHGVIVKRFPKTPQAKDSLLTIARVQEKFLDFGPASASFIAFQRRYPKAKEAAPALAKACELQIAASGPQTVQICSAFARKVPEAAVGYIERMIRAAALSKNYNMMNQLITKVYLKSFNLSANQRIIAWKRIYDSTGGKGSNADQARQRMLGIYQGAPQSVEGEALRAIGSFKLEEALRLMPRYVAVKLNGGNVQNMLGSIQQKTAALGQVVNAFQQVLAVKDAYSGAAAFTLIGQAYEHYADLLENPPAIQGASKEDVVKELAGQIMQNKKEAYAFYQQAVNTVSQFNVYSPYIGKAIEGMARVQGGQISFDDFVVPADFVGNEVPVNWVNDLSEK